MKFLRFLIPTFLILISCKEEIKKKKPPLPKWLEGEWITPSDSIQFIENWKIANDSLMSGIGLAYNSTDTLFGEELSIRRVDDTLYYIPTVADQNNGKSVWFRIIKADNLSFFAENMAHDFPKTIEYKLIRQDSLCAILKGKDRLEVFPMRRK